MSMLTRIEVESTEHLEGVNMGDVDGLSRNRVFHSKLVGS